MTLEEELELLNQQASYAVNSGRDPAAVEKMLLDAQAKVRAKYGYKDEQSTTEPGLFDNVKAGHSSTSPKLSKKYSAERMPWYQDIDSNPTMAAINYVPYAPGQYKYWKAVGKAIDAEKEAQEATQPGFFDNLTSSLYQGVNSAARTALDISGGLGALQGNDTASNEAFALRDKLKQSSNDVAQYSGADPNSMGGLLGGIAAGIPTLGTGTFDESFDVLNENGNLKQALGTMGVNLAANEAGLLSGKLFPNSMSKRVLAQGSAAAAAMYGGQKLKNEFVPEGMVHEPTLKELGYAFGGGAIGGIFPNKAPEKSTKDIESKGAIDPSTGDPQLDAGIAAYNSHFGDKIEYSPEDIAAKGNEWVSVPRAEQIPFTQKGPSNIGAVTDANVSVNPFRRPDLEKQAQEDAMWAERDPNQSPAVDPGVDAVIPQANEALRTPEMETLGAQLRAKPVFEAAAWPEQTEAEVTTSPLTINDRWPVVKPKAASETAPQFPTEGVTQAKKLGTFTYKLNADGNPEPVTSGAKHASPKKAAESLHAEALAAAKQKLQHAYGKDLEEGATGDPSVDRMSTDVWDSFNKGTLTVKQLLTSIVDNHEGLFSDLTHTREFARIMLDTAERLGNVNSLFRKHEGEALEKTKADPDAAGLLPEGNVAAFYDPPDHAIYVNRGLPKALDLMHEVDHLNLANAVEKGLARKLSAKQQSTFDDLSSTFDQLRDHVDAGRERDPNSGHRYTDGSKRLYAFDNIHEFMAEFKSRQEVRDFLAEIYPDDMPKTSVREGAKAKAATFFKNIMDSIPKLLGLSPKADTMRDVMYSLMHKFEQGTSMEDTILSEKDKSLYARHKYEGTSEVAATDNVSGLRKESRVPNVIRGLFGKPLPQIQAARDRSKGGINLTNVKADQFARKANDLVASNPDVLQHLNNLAEDRSSAEAKASYDALKAMGGHAAELADDAMGISKESLNIGLKQLETSDPGSFRSNLGIKSVEGADTYLASTYALHKIKDFGKQVRRNYDVGLSNLKSNKALSSGQKSAVETVNAVKDFLRTNVYAEGSEASKKVFNVETAIDQDINAFLGLTKDDATSLGKTYRNMMIGKEALSAKQNVPEVFRKLAGEDTNPIVRLAETIRKQGAVLAQEQAMIDVRDAGMGKFLTDKKGVDGYTHQIQGEKYGALNGLYTTPDVALMLEGMSDAGIHLGEFGKALLADPTAQAAYGSMALKVASGLRKVTSGLKTVNIVGNLPAAMIKNGVGSPAQAISNGNISIPHWGQGLKAALNLFSATTRKSLSSDAAELTRLGLNEASQLAESVSPAAKKMLLSLANKEHAKPEDLSYAGIMSHLKDMGYTGQHLVTLAKEAYGMADLWSKYANYFYERDFWLKREAKKGPVSEERAEQIRKEIADRINNTNVTPSRAWGIAKLSDAAGATQFFPYAAEIARSTMHNIKYGAVDFVQGAKEKDNALMMHGVKRILGTITAVGYMSKMYSIGLKGVGGALGLLAAKSGEDEDTQKYLQTSEMLKGGDPVVLKDSKGNTFTIDGGSWNPYDQISRPSRKLFEAMGKAKDGDIQGAENAMKEVSDILMHTVGTSSIWAHGKRLWNGKEPAWAKDNPKLYEEMLAGLRESGASDENINRGLSVLSAAGPKALVAPFKVAGRDDISPSSKNLIGSGFALMSADPLVDLNKYGGAMARGELAASKTAYSNMLKKNVNTTPAQAEPYFKDGLEQIAETSNKLQLAVKAAKEQGKSTKQIVETFKLAGLSDDLITQVMRGKVKPALLMAVDLKRDFEKDVKTAKSAEDRKEAFKRYRTNEKLINSFMMKYRNKSVEEILNGQ